MITDKLLMKKFTSFLQGNSKVARHHVLFCMKYRQSSSTSSRGDEADIKDEAVSHCHTEFKPEINWF